MTYYTNTGQYFCWTPSTSAAFGINNIPLRPNLSQFRAEFPLMPTPEESRRKVDVSSWAQV